MNNGNEQKEDFTLVEKTIRKLAQDNLFFCNSDDKQAYIAVQKKAGLYYQSKAKTLEFG